MKNFFACLVDEIIFFAAQKADVFNFVVKRAHEEADRIVEHASREAELEKQKAADDVKKEMVVLASMMAGKVVSQNIDTRVQDSIIEETLTQMGESTWLN